KQVSLRLSPEVIRHFKKGGKGWQSRIDETLRKVVRRKAS
ncbi:MAG: BrnA antitoxin family protein, partial [Bradyrhizobium sp.]